jgi:hypothetical protein
MARARRELAQIDLAGLRGLIRSGGLSSPWFRLIEPGVEPVD